MSVREEDEDRQNKNCSSRGLGLAAAAIGVGVGVGAALYYFFSKRQENPNDEGSTSTWECEQAQAFSPFRREEHGNPSEDSYTTLSEHSTTDTSMHESPFQRNCCCNNSPNDSDTDDDNDSDSNDSMIWSNSSDWSDSSVSEQDYSESEEGILDDDETGYMTLPVATTSAASDLDNDWDVTNSSTEVPQDTRAGRSPLFRILNSIGEYVSPRRDRVRGRRKTREQEQLDMLRAQALSEAEQINFLRDQSFRERSWSLEECSICFDVILNNQEVMSLPCTHHFHTACILPWLQEQQTCPNCRKAAE